MNFSAVLNHWLHLISAVIWIGGSAYQVFVLAPLLQSGDTPLETLLATAKRFRQISLVALMTLVVTGGINHGIRRAGQRARASNNVNARQLPYWCACSDRFPARN